MGRPYWQNTIFPSLTSHPYRWDVLSPQITTAFVLLMCTQLQAWARRADRERFFTSELPALFYAASQSVLQGGDFNRVLHPTDMTDPFTTSRALSEVVQGLALSDAWSQDPQCPAYKHYSPNGASRIDRFYITHDLLLRNTDIEIPPTAFTDHNAVFLRLSIPTEGTGWIRGRWKMDPIMVTEATVKDKIQCALARW